MTKDCTHQNNYCRMTHPDIVCNYSNMQHILDRLIVEYQELVD